MFINGDGVIELIHPINNLSCDLSKSIILNNYELNSNGISPEAIKRTLRPFDLQKWTHSGLISTPITLALYLIKSPIPHPTSSIFPFKYELNFG